MRLKTSIIISLFLLFMSVSTKAGAELSVANQWRIDQAEGRCQNAGNKDLMFPEYWGDRVTDDNWETVCMAEIFAQLVSVDGNNWLEDKASVFIDTCKEKSSKDKKEYYPCLQAGLQKVTKQLSEPCEELGESGLWDENRCRRLVTYIFLKDFDKILMAKRPLINQLMDNTILKILFSPILAIVFLLLYVLDVVLITDPGNWMRIPKFCFIVGTIILASWFFKSEMRFIGMAVAVIVCIIGIIMNHVMGLFKEEEEPQGKKKFSRW